MNFRLLSFKFLISIIIVQDDPDYVLTTNLGTLKRCAWVGQKEARMIRYCDTWNSGRMVSVDGFV